MRRVFAPHLNKSVTLGACKLPKHRPRRLRIGQYLKFALPPAPPTSDYSQPAMACLRDIYGNAQYGDCVIAGAYHMVGVETGNAGNLFAASDAQVLADYSAITGFNPNDPSTDQGTDPTQAFAYWTQTGFCNGTKLLTVAEVDATNWAEVQACMVLFENLFPCINLPDAWVQSMPTADGFVWDMAPPDPQNGHFLCGVGHTPQGLTIDSWALLGILTPAALAGLCTASGGGALFVALTPDQLAKGQAKAPNGVAWADLYSDIYAIEGVPPPSPPPAPPAPSPSPTPGQVSLEQAIAWSRSKFGQHLFYTDSSAQNLITQGLTENWPAAGKKP